MNSINIIGITCGIQNDANPIPSVETEQTFDNPYKQKRNPRASHG